MRRMLSMLSSFLRSPTSPTTSTRKLSTRTYEDAVTALNSLQSNAATLEAVRASGGRLSQFAHPEMIEYLERIGYRPEDLNKLNVVHITGTKGKGSTSAFCDSMLRKTVPSWKVGLYTSPHLVAVRERIRINGEPISEADFTQYFFEVWDRLQQNTTRALPQTSLMPAYFRFMTILAFHYFLSIKVDATILEVGVGGLYDSTNVVPKPVVTGVTSLGVDHTAVLGNTLKEIGHQKGGIYKPGVPALTVEQPEEGMASIRDQAKAQRASSFTVVETMPELQDIKLGLSGAHQFQNASLAVNLVHQYLLARQPDIPDFLPSLYPTPLPPSYVAGLEATRFPGRCQEIADPEHTAITWYLDGAHTVESLTSCTEWFFQPTVGLKQSDQNSKRQRVLIFNCTSGRNGEKFLNVVLEGMKRRVLGNHINDGAELVERGFFDHVIFCTNITYVDGRSKADLTNNTVDMDALSKLKVQNELAQAWTTLVPNYPKDHIHVLPSVQHAIEVIHGLESAGKVDVLVAGSLHLVGGVIEVSEIGSIAMAT
ncbi:Folylpolyglutamate synthetase [Tulasnella sp. 424]|nr:Folylpolyglutamate synthetase [Tulasnella sp. 424]KAG8981962.1 Folylpolyglutamate synthetase [Tulasnella sp. 425]